MRWVSPEVAIPIVEGKYVVNYVSYVLYSGVKIKIRTGTMMAFFDGRKFKIPYEVSEWLLEE